jgi:pilus assembly protein CpaE
MSAVAAVAEKPSAQKLERVGVIAILQDQPTLERIQAIVRELHLDDELSLEATLDAALRRMREGENPRVLIIDLSDSAAPIAELSAARTVGGDDIKIVALGVVNDVAFFRDLLAAGATDYVVKPVSREALAAALEKRSATA